MNKYLVSLTILVTVAQAHALHTLTCYDTYSKMETPVMTATMASDTTLKNIKFTSDNEELKSTDVTITGAMVVSNHSPYKGDIIYNLPNGISLVLPTSLANSDLEDAFTQGIGFNKNENGVLFGCYSDSDDDGSGCHFSVRLKCESDK